MIKLTNSATAPKGISQSLRDRSVMVSVSSCLERQTKSILIQIKDEGIGIPQEVLNHIAEPFYSTRNDEGDIGLGFLISFTIVNDHQGSLTFLSETGRGTTAPISFPALINMAERNRNAADHIS